MMLSPHDWLTKPRIVAGIMTGTSLDGIDATIARFEYTDGGAISIEVLSYAALDFPRPLQRQLYRLIEHPITIAELSDTSTILMMWYAQALEKAIGLNRIKLDAIGIHGQTLWHAPEPHIHLGIECRSTYQLACPAILSTHFSVPVVSDFRTMDIALGGQGAPLAPILDWEILRSQNDYVIALNIGGIANITLLPPSCSIDEVQAFDTGPGNVWIDAAMHRYWGKKYDEYGRTAAAGNIDYSLFERLKKIPFVTDPPPKSTGRELFSRAMLEEIIAPLESRMPAEDIVATLTAFTAWSIAENIRLFSSETATVVISGGGVQNYTLISLLAKQLPSSRIVLLSEYCTIGEQAKEALLMGYIAFRTLGGLPSNIRSVTGARTTAILGSITFPPGS